MKKLNIKLFRDIKEAKGQFLAIILVIAVGAFFYAGLITISNDLSAYTKVYFKDHNLADLNVYYSEISSKDISQMQELSGVKRIEGRYTFTAKQVFEEYNATLNVHSIPRGNEINTIYVTSGSIPAAKDEILLDSRYAEEHQYQVGERIQLQTNTGKYDFVISGLGENVEYIFNIEDPSLVLPDHKIHGVAYMNEERIREIAGSLYYNELIVDVEDGDSIEQIGQSIQTYSKDLSYLYQVDRERSVSNVQLNITITNNRMMSTVAPLILFIVAAITIFLTMSRLIDSQRGQIGVMKALGVSTKSILFHYMKYPVVVGVLGSIAGWIITALAFVPLLDTVVEQTYSIPDFSLSIGLATIFPPIVVSIVVGIIACYLSGRSILKEGAAQAMRPKQPKKMKKILVEQIPVLWRNLSYGNKLILRNIFLNKPKALASSIGVIVCVVLLVIAFGFESSMQTIAGQIHKVYTYDLKVDYKGEIDAQKALLPAGVNQSYSLMKIPVEIAAFEEDKGASLIVTENTNSLIHFFDAEGNPITITTSGMLVPKSYSDQYNISVGDHLTMNLVSSELKGQSVDVKVAQITTQYTEPAFYATPEYMQSLGIEYKPTSLVVTVDSPADKAGVQSAMEQDAYVNNISDKSDVEKSVDNIVEQNNPVFIIFILCAVILSFGAMYTISSINIYERTRELATLKVLGYQKNNLNRIIFVENIVLTTFAIVIALPISGYMYRLVVKALSSSNQLIPDRLSVFTVALAIVLTYILTIISNLLLRRKVTQINMIESLKSVE